jgi:hypothetical protein
MGAGVNLGEGFYSPDSEYNTYGLFATQVAI